MRTRRALVGMAGALLVLLTASLVRADFLRGVWEWVSGPAPKQPEGQPTAGSVMVSEVIVQGSSLTPTKTILAQIKTRPGAAFSLPVLDADVNTLRATHQFAGVHADLSADGPGRVKVLFFVRDQPQKVEKVTFVGARAFAEKDLAAIPDIRVGSPVNPDLNRWACRKIVERYHEAGRPFATCTLLKGGIPTDSEVLFSITEGPRVAVRDVRFDGNNFVGAPALTGLVRTRNALQTSGGKFDPALAEADAAELKKYYRSLGYEHARVSRELHWDEGGRTVSLVFHIDEGVRYQAADAPPRPAAPVVDAGSGIRLVAQESVAPAKEMSPAKIGKIHVAGNKVIPTALILAQSGLIPGQVLSYPDLKKAEEELAKLKFLEVDAAGGVRPTVTVIDSESEVKDLLIFVKEKEAK
jgi:outer membrane protein assembly factor BamA